LEGRGDWTNLVIPPIFWMETDLVILQVFGREAATRLTW
jgi:hypothetical protein